MLSNIKKKKHLCKTSIIINWWLVYISRFLVIYQFSPDHITRYIWSPINILMVFHPCLQTTTIVELKKKTDFLLIRLCIFERKTETMSSYDQIWNFFNTHYRVIYANYSSLIDVLFHIGDWDPSWNVFSLERTEKRRCQVNFFTITIFGDIVLWCDVYLTPKATSTIATDKLTCQSSCWA